MLTKKGSARIPLSILTFIAIGAMLLVAAAPALPVGEWYAFKPKDFARIPGKPALQTATFSILNPNTDYFLKIWNGGVDGQYKKRVSSAVVWLNGKVVAGPSDFNQNVTVITKKVKLQMNNTLKVQLRSSPMSGMTIAVIGIDHDLPTITYTLTPAPNAAGWNNTPVLVHFICNDMTSGIASCSPDVTVSTEGKDQTVTGTAVDNAQNVQTVTVHLNIDLTPPTITAVVTPTPNADGWNNSDATVTFTCSDALSGLAGPCPAPFTVTAEGITKVTGSVMDVAGNTGTVAVDVKIDKTPPVVTITSPTPAAAITAPGVHVEGTIVETGSGVKGVTCNGVATTTFTNTTFSCDLVPPDGAVTVDVVVTDKAGWTGTASVSVTFTKSMAAEYKKK